MEEERLKAILESLLFAASEPVSIARLTAVLDNVSKEAIRKALNEMTIAYASGRGIVLEQVAGGYQLRTPKEHALYVRKLLAAKPPRLTRPLLETLAIVAYRQPITRPEIEQLRGVDTGGVLETLLERRLIKIAGRKEAPGRPMVYATTPEFLEAFSLKDLDSLPDLSEFKEIQEAAERASEQTPEPPAEPSPPSPEQLELNPPAESDAETASAEGTAPAATPETHPDPQESPSDPDPRDDEAT
ncbi:MAG: SMC-Scp complex subunit ScpB [Candidatus Binataceae bacterium]